MADNLNIDAGSTLTVGTDEIAGVHYQIVKVAHGAADSISHASASAPMPVTVISATLGTVAVSLSSTAVTISNIPAVTVNSGNINVSSATLGTVTIAGNVNVATATLGTVTISGNVNVASATLGTLTINLPTNASTESEQQSQTTHLATIAGDTTNMETALQIIDDWDESDRAKVNPIVGSAGVAGGAGAVGATTQRVVQANDAGKTLSSSSGTTTLTNTTILIAGSAKNKVYAFSLTTTSTTGVICAFQAGIGGTELWRVLLQAPSGASAGANLAIEPPSYLFASASNGTLNLNLSEAVRVDFSVAYYNEI